MNIRECVKTAAIVLIAIGILCLPIGFGANPKRDTSVFYNFADLGIFLKIGLGLLAIGLFIFLVIAFIPSRNN